MSDLPREAEVRDRLFRSCEAFNRGDFDAATEFVHPDIEIVLPGGQTPRTGAAALRAWMEPDAFEDQHFEMVESTVKADKILVRQIMRARGAGSGIEIKLDLWSVWTFDSAGLWTRLEGFLPHEKARARRSAGFTE